MRFKTGVERNWKKKWLTLDKERKGEENEGGALEGRRKERGQGLRLEAKKHEGIPR